MKLRHDAAADLGGKEPAGGVARHPFQRRRRSDGEAATACTASLSDCAGRSVTTIEGLSPDGSHPVQRAWLEEQTPQCGYCQPGMIMAVAALLKRSPNPTDDEISAAITNLCRCGTYPRVRRAISRAVAT